jgi:hypothetical protein
MLHPWGWVSLVPTSDVELGARSVIGTFRTCRDRLTMPAH